MPNKVDPDRLLYPSLTGRIVMDTWRGKVRVRKWPEKRGTPKSEAVRFQNRWFREASRLATRAPGSQITAAMIATRNSGLYPRDLLMRFMAGNLGPITTADGLTLQKAPQRIEPVSFQGTIQNLTIAKALVGNVGAILTWSLPQYDPLGLWSAGAPTRITVPANVSIVRVTGGMFTSAGNTSFMRAFILKNGFLVAHAMTGIASFYGGTLDTGAILVTPGDFFELQVVPSKNLTLDANAANFLSLEFLTAL